MKKNLEITNASGGAAFTVRVVTRARQTEIGGVGEDGILKVRLTAASADGAANDELVSFLAQELGVEAARVEVVAGREKHEKIISIDGVAPEVLEEKLLSVSKSE